jgi:ribosomal protein S18 acetylase RimI-like enzyme
VASQPDVAAARRAHGDFLAFTRWRARHQAGAQLLDRDGVLAIAGPTDFPASRVALLADPPGAQDAATAVAAVDAGHAYLAERGRTAIFYVPATPDDPATARLADLGYRAYGDTPEMACERRLPDQAPGGGATVRLATTEADACAYAGVAAAAFTALGIPADETRTHLGDHGALLAADVVVALADVDGDVAAGAMALLVPEQDAAYVAWVSTLEPARGRGLGEAVTRRVTNEAFDRGATLVTLEASRYGESVYRRMGYRELYRYRTMLRL